MNNPSPITPQLLLLTLFLTITWGVYFAHTILELTQQARPTSSVGVRISNYRRLVVALCLFLLPLSFFIRTGMVFVGFGNDVAGQVVFFTLAGSNVLGSVFVDISLLFDD